jgi:hypothetical protein
MHAAAQGRATTAKLVARGHVDPGALLREALTQTLSGPLKTA